MIDSIYVVVVKAPGEEDSTLGIRFLNAAYMSDIDAKILCTGEGVYNLIRNGGYNTEVLKELIHEGAEAFCTKECLEERGVVKDLLIENVAIISRDAVADTIDGCVAVVVF